MSNETNEHALREMSFQLAVISRQVSILTIFVNERLSDMTPTGPLTEIAQTVADHSNITLALLRGERRDRKLIDARQGAMWLCMELTDVSSVRIGKYFRRDHATVLYARKSVEIWRERRDPRFSNLSALRVLLDAKINPKAVGGE